MLIFNDTVSMGDTLMTFPTVMEMLEQTPEPSKIYWTNPDVGSLFPYERYGAVFLQERVFDAERVARLSLHDYVWSRNGWNHSHGGFHEAALTKHGFRVRAPAPVSVAFKHDPSVPTYDFILAPHVLNNAWKNMQPAFWQCLIDALVHLFNASVCIIGTSRLPSDENLLKIEYDLQRFKSPAYQAYNINKYLRGADYFWDEPLQRVAQLLSNVRVCFISVDSGPSHLMKAIRRPHIELFHDCLVLRHVEGEEQRVVDCRVLTIPVVLRTIAELLAKHPCRG